VVLIDEVEKLFSYTNIADSSGVTKSMLGQFLWFLQESEARVTFVMTTNDQKAIPPELIRPGRIDTKMLFRGLTPEEIPAFAKLILGRYQMTADGHFTALVSKLKENTNPFTPQAEVENAVIQYVKDRMIKKQGAA
jgi:SpoVK/Ycf46/Vps4 family AAA+-type ATPase